MDNAFEHSGTLDPDTAYFCAEGLEELVAKILLETVVHG